MKILILCLVSCSVFAYVHSECHDSMGQVMSDGAGPYIGEDHCNSCFCKRGMDVCTKMFCLPGHSRCMGPDKRIYNEGDSFPAADGCNTCFCDQNGAVSCTEMACIIQ